jgi:uncharacterized protein
LEQKLRSLYLLQLLDTELDELRELRGDLPEAVNKLEKQVEEMESKIQEYDEFLKTGAVDRQRKDKESLELIEKIDKYKQQQLDVKNNKEYDALTHQIESAETTITTYEEEIELFADEATDVKEKKEKLEQERDTLKEDLELKHTELGDILSATNDEESQISDKRNKAIADISEDDLAMYKKIRDAKTAAVVRIKRGSCSGCYNVVPPQLILEIKKNDRMYICEHCGRILVSEELATETSI